MKVYVKGTKQEITLDKKHFLASGGEGKIYVKGNRVYKICDPGKMIPDGKFQELAVLTDPHIIRPEELLLDQSNKPVGYSMRYVDNCFTLCQIFTKAFRLRNNVTQQVVLNLVQQMQKTISFIHSKGILIVDLNELNFLIDSGFADVFFIDVNSYQTRHYPATAIMDSIRDRHCGNKFSELTDWFSFGIVSCEMLVGIHPYKGRHPKFPDPKTAMDERMKHNLSIFNSGVSYPQAACQPLTTVPDAYLQWYKHLFEDGIRTPPPSDLLGPIVAVVISKQIVGSNVFDMQEIRDYGADILKFYHSTGREVVVTSTEIYVDNRPQPKPVSQVKIGFTSKGNSPIAAYLDRGLVHLYDLTARADIPFNCGASRIMDFDGRLYLHNGTDILEVVFSEMGNQIFASPSVVGHVMERGTQFFDGVAIQNLFDAYYVSIFPQSRQCYQHGLKDLDGHKLVDAKFEGHVLMVVGVDIKTGLYNRFVFRFSKDWSDFELAQIVKDISYVGLNFTVLDNGICVCLTEEEKIEVFRAEKSGGNIKSYDDPVIEGDMILTHRGSTALFTKDKILYSIAVRKQP